MLRPLTLPWRTPVTLLLFVSLQLCVGAIDSSSDSSSSSGSSDGSSSTGVSLATDGLIMPSAMSSSCPPVHFLVPMFGGSTGSNKTDASTAAVDADDDAAAIAAGATPNSYHTASDQAHIILGLLLLCMVFSWGGFVMEVWSLQWASRLSGMFHIMMGVYLFMWLFVFMHPQDIPALWDYWTRDLLQLQHAAIASLLVCGGIIECMQGWGLIKPMCEIRKAQLVQQQLQQQQQQSNGSILTDLNGKITSSGDWHMVWSLTLILVGLVFMQHPQHTYSATIKHLLLGSVLIIGSPLMVRGKTSAWKTEIKNEIAMAAAAAAAASSSSAAARRRPASSPHQIDSAMVAAGGSFAVAACLLLAFRETANLGTHVGTTVQCQPSVVILVMALITSSVATVIVVASAVQQYRLLQQRKERCSATGIAASTDTSSSSAASPGGWIAAIRGLFDAIRTRYTMRMFRRLWGPVDEEEREDMVVGVERMSPGSSSTVTAATSAATMSNHTTELEDVVVLPTRALQQQHAEDDLHSVTTTGSSSNGLVSSYTHAASSKHKLRASPPVSPPPATAASLHSLHHDEHEEEVEERSWQERQRDKRRQEEYTGEEED